jgi:hypothetical protein
VRDTEKNLGVVDLITSCNQHIYLLSVQKERRGHPDMVVVTEGVM